MNQQNPYAPPQPPSAPYNPYQQQPPYGGDPYGRPLKPHRGGAVLALGICGLAVCAICGIIAWAMGNADLKEMQAGIMDPAGESLTRAGKICGMIATILLCVFGGIYLVVGVLAAAA